MGCSRVDDILGYTVRHFMADQWSMVTERLGVGRELLQDFWTCSEHRQPSTTDSPSVSIAGAPARIAARLHFTAG